MELLRRSIALHPTNADAHSNLGNILRENGRIDEAVAACREAIAINPGLPEAHTNLGNALKDRRELNDAIAAYRQAITLRPNYAVAHSNLAVALMEGGQVDDAIAASRQAIAIRSNYAEAHNNLGSALMKKGEIDAAIAAYRAAVALKPNYAEAHNNLGNALRDNGQIDQAIDSYRRAIAFAPKLSEACNNLGIALVQKGQLDAAIAAYRQAIALNPGLAQPHNNLGNALKDSGQLDDAITAFRHAVALDRDSAAIGSNLIYALHFHSGYDADKIAQEQRPWNRQHAEPMRELIGHHANDRSSDRLLRVGYLSADFREHVVGRNLLPLFQQHDHRKFEITGYAQVPRPDSLTSQLQQHADRWRSIVGLSDEDVARQIRDDRIDILVDLTLHMANNRLLVFARKPAPVQVTFAGYPGSTGLTAIDYRLSDPYLDPPGVDESVYSEKTLRLPNSFWCYDPLECRDIPVNSLPAMANGIITFGCLNSFAKINAGVLGLWGQVMRQVSGSRLLVLAEEGGHRGRMLDCLSQEGIDREQIEFAIARPRRQYLELYHRIDIGLDSFPYNGHTTSLDSLWMGVPVVTLAGQTAVSRAGLVPPVEPEPDGPGGPDPRAVRPGRGRTG